MLGLSGGSSKSKSSSTSYLPVQADWLNQILPMYGQQAGQGQNVYSGQRVAGMTPQQQEAMNVSGWSNYLDPNALGTNLQYGQTGTALSGLLTGQAGAEPYTEDSINTLMESAYSKPTWKQFNEVEKPTIQESFSGPGYWGTARMNAVAKGAQDTADTLSAQRGALGWEAEQANKAIEEAKAGRSLSAIPLGTAYAQAPTQQAISAIEGRGALYGLASPEQQQQQAEIDANIQRFAEANRLTDPESMDILMQLLGMNYSSAKSSGSAWNAGVEF